MARHGNTDYTEAVPGSPEYAFGRDASRVTRQILVRWSKENIAQAIKDFVGYPELDRTDAAHPCIRRNVPHSFPDFPWMYCVGCSRVEGIGPRGKKNDVAKYEWAKLTLTYEALKWPVRRDGDVINFGYEGLPDEATLKRYVTKSARPAGQYVTVTKGMMKRQADSLPIPEGIPVYQPWLDISYTWVDVPTLPIRAMETCLGAINDSAFDGYTAETLLLTSATYERSTAPHGLPTYTIQYGMKWLPNLSRDGTNTPRGHNWVLAYTAAGDVDFMKVTSKGAMGGTELHRKVDFQLLFRPDP